MGRSFQCSNSLFAAFLRKLFISTGNNPNARFHPSFILFLNLSGGGAILSDSWSPGPKTSKYLYAEISHFVFLTSDDSQNVAWREARVSKIRSSLFISIGSRTSGNK